MQIHKTRTYDDMSLYAANMLLSIVQDEEITSICITSGSTPIGMYEELAKQDHHGYFKHIDFYAMDECIGIEEDNPYSNAYYFNTYLHSKISMHTFLSPSTKGYGMNSEYYYKVLCQLPFDILILGVGNDGHIAFNMPNEHFSTKFHKETLNVDYINHLKKDTELPIQIPKEAVTLGVKDILSARKIMLLASGKNKAQALFKLWSNKIDPQYPISILQLHPDLHVIADEDALSFEGCDMYG